MIFNGKPIVLDQIEGMPRLYIKDKDIDKIDGATMMLAEDLAKRIKTAMGKS